jgi:hypothetical protein
MKYAFTAVDKGARHSYYVVKVTFTIMASLMLAAEKIFALRPQVS